MIDKYNASKGYHFGWLNLPETPNIFVLEPSPGLTHKKNKSNHAQGAYLFTSFYSVFCMYDTLYGPSVQIGPSQLLTVAHIISPHPSLPETAHHEPPSIGKARIEVC